MDEIPEQSERSSPCMQYDSISFEGSRYEIVETLEPPSMENVSRKGSSRQSFKPEETTFMKVKDPNAESRSTLEFKHIRNFEEMKNDPEVLQAKIKHKMMLS